MMVPLFLCLDMTIVNQGVILTRFALNQIELWVPFLFVNMS